ncbi:hypothetical protein [uncultured Enterococcus sp.]|uniref:hypothetical protein n=1 Tax=uncultured Enterococcus sp. TaxID=167972 RepID=UPI002AA64D94|nr:hypothetical protein [uncultured Enterococcus sp.]
MKTEYQKFNINQFVKVKLTETGIKIYQEKFLKYGGKAPELIIDDNGFSKFQMHDLMNTFGEYLFMGNIDMPFETNILIEA